MTDERIQVTIECLRGSQRRRKTGQKLGNVELAQQLIDVQREALDLVEENRALREQVRQLERGRDVGNRLFFDGAQYWLSRDDGQKDGPILSDLLGYAWQARSYARGKRGALLV